MNRRFLHLGLLLLAVPVRAADYTVVSVSGLRQVQVTVSLGAGKASTEFHMPAWAPGDYQIFNYGTRVASIQFFRGGVEVQAVKGDDPNLWMIDGGADRTVYMVTESRGNFGPNLRVTADEMFVSGPGVIGWFAGHTNEPQSLHLSPGDMKVAVALPKSKTETDTYLAKDYDHLIDSPFVVSRNLQIKEFMAGGKEHYVAAYNQPTGVDLDAYASVCTKAVESSKEIFGELPYAEYWFMFDFGGPGGGLEHRDSCKIGLRPASTAEEAVGIIFHEYFHAFNVKRIRSAVLGPFDYTKPAVTGALWWLEGVTDYYADVLAVRASIDSRGSFLAAMTRTYNGFHRGAGYQRVSANDSSVRVWESGRSQGYGFSYYTKGKLVGMALDLSIRGETHNQHSLDDVMTALYRETVNGPGFREGRIRELCVQFGGERTGRLYDVCVEQAVRIPLESVLDPLGMGMGNGAIVDVPGAPSEAKALGRTYPMPTW